MPTTCRKLAAVMFTDIVGYTSLMGKDEKNALQIIDDNKQNHLKYFKKYKGTLVKEIGDGILASFGSSLEAVRCAIEIQKQTLQNESYRVRIGLHQGDILFKDGDIYGDGVNIASRIEPLAAAGGICISGEIAESIRSSGIKMVYLGKKELKNAGYRKIWAISEDDISIPQKFEEQRTKEIPNNLPRPSTSFIGRENELMIIEELVSKCRLTTISGAGGSGKTRFAMEVGRRLLNEFPDGIWLVELADILNEKMVPQEVSQALGIKELYGQDQTVFISERIRDQQLLIILDNCEHLVNACAKMLDYLLAHTLKPRFLITSREILNVAGEETWTIPVMRYPQESEIDSEKIINYESVQLFCERASVAGEKLVINEFNANVIARICKSLDGIPLALELAASRTRIMQPEIILSRLVDKFRLLKSSPRAHQPRHQTLKATIDWSFDLLSNNEKILFNRLSIFAGDFSLDTAEKICGFDPINQSDVMDLLQMLVDKSLVLIVRNETEENRYQLLEIIKQYGKDNLSESEELQQLIDIFYNYYLLIAKASHFNYLKDSPRWISTLGKEYFNLIAALDYNAKYLSKQLQLAGFIGWYWTIKSNFLQGINYLENPLKNYQDQDIIAGRALNTLGILLVFVQPKSVEVLEKASKILKDQKSTYDLALNLNWFGFALWINNSDPAKGTKLLQESVEVAEQTKDPWLIQHCKTKNTFPLIGPYFAEYNPKHADLIEPIIKSNLEEAKKMNLIEDIGWNSIFYGDCAFLRRDGKLVERRYGNALSFNYQNNNKEIACAAMLYIAYGLAMQNRYPKARRLEESSFIGHESVGTSRNLLLSEGTPARKARDQFWHPEIAGISEKELEQYTVEGTAMSWEEAVQYALDTERD